jgi:hypothetical protein
MATPRPGDIVSRRKGVVMHKGLVMADGTVLHNTPFQGETRVSMSEFAAGQRVYVEHQETDVRLRALRRAELHDPRGYDLLRNNCEHTVHRLSNGKAESPQLQSWVAALGIAGAAFVITRHPGIAAAGFALGKKLMSRARER